MEFKGTKGEWKLVNQTQVVFSKDDFNTKDCDLYEHQYDSFEELIANAKLLAASKDLLKALQETDKDLCVLWGQVKHLEESNPRAEGLSDLIQKWRDRNKEAINKALN